MSESVHESLVDDLVGGLAPVRRLSPPAWRAAAWLAAVLALAAILMPMADMACASASPRRTCAWPPSAPVSPRSRPRSPPS